MGEEQDDFSPKAGSAIGNGPASFLTNIWYAIAHKPFGLGMQIAVMYLYRKANAPKHTAINQIFSLIHRWLRY